MHQFTLSDFAHHLTADFNAAEPWQSSLRMMQDEKLAVYYAPFEYINRKVKVVLCGITPGSTQASEALRVAQRVLLSGGSLTEAQAAAKKAASFAKLRKSLTAMLDAVHLNQRLGLTSCDSLFGADEHLVHYTSALRYPVVLSSGQGYNGTPKPHKHPYLRAMLDTYLTEEVETLGLDTLWVPLGGAASESLEYLCDRGVLQRNQLLDGLPHPSGANQERIQYFLGNKPKELLSSKTNAVKLDQARENLMRKVLSM